MKVFYLIKNSNEVTAELLNASLCSTETARKSLDQTKTLLKFEADPNDSLFSGESTHTIDEDFLTKGEW